MKWNLANELSFLKDESLISEEMLELFSNTLQKTGLFKEGDGLKIKNTFYKYSNIETFDNGDRYTNENMKVIINDNLTLTSLYMHNVPDLPRDMTFKYTNEEVSILFTVLDGYIDKYRYNDGDYWYYYQNSNFFTFDISDATEEEKDKLVDAYYNETLSNNKMLSDYYSEGGLKPVSRIRIKNKEKTDVNDLIATNILEPELIARGLRKR